MKRDHSSRAIPYYIYRPGMSMKFLQISYLMPVISLLNLTYLFNIFIVFTFYHI